MLWFNFFKKILRIFLILQYYIYISFICLCSKFHIPFKAWTHSSSTIPNQASSRVYFKEQAITLLEEIPFSTCKHIDYNCEMSGTDGEVG